MIALEEAALRDGSMLIVSSPKDAPRTAPRIIMPKRIKQRSLSPINPKPPQEPDSRNNVPHRFLTFIRQ